MNIFEDSSIWTHLKKNFLSKFNMRITEEGHSKSYMSFMAMFNFLICQVLFCFPHCQRSMMLLRKSLLKSSDLDSRKGTEDRWEKLPTFCSTLRSHFFTSFISSLCCVTCLLMIYCFHGSAICFTCQTCVKIAFHVLKCYSKSVNSGQSSNRFWKKCDHTAQEMTASKMIIEVTF